MKRIIISIALLLPGLVNAAATKPATTSTALTNTTSTTAATACGNLATPVTTSAITAATTTKPHSLVTLTTKLYMDLSSGPSASSLSASHPSYAASVMASQALYTQTPDILNALKAKKETERLHDLLDQAGKVGIDIAQELEKTHKIVAEIPEFTKFLASLQALAPLFRNKECSNCLELQKQLVARQEELIKSQEQLAAIQKQLITSQTEQLRLTRALAAAPESYGLI